MYNDISCSPHIVSTASHQADQILPSERPTACTDTRSSGRGGKICRETLRTSGPTDFTSGASYRVHCSSDRTPCTVARKPTSVAGPGVVQWPSSTTVALSSGARATGAQPGLATARSCAAHSSRSSRNSLLLWFTTTHVALKTWWSYERVARNVVWAGQKAIKWGQDRRPQKWGHGCSSQPPRLARGLLAPAWSCARWTSLRR